MRKQILSAILSMAMLFTAITPVSAAEASIPDCPEQSVIDINTEIERAINGETDLELDASDIASATLMNADGTTGEVNVYVTTRELQVDRSANGDGTIYATTVVAEVETKKEYGRKEKEYVTGTLTLYWKDYWGLENAFEGLSGAWSVVKNPDTGKTPVLSNRKVELVGGGPPAMGSFDQCTIYPSTNTFSIAKGGDVRDGWTYYKATSTVMIDGGSTLKVEVGTSILS